MVMKRDFWYEPGNSVRRLHIYLPDGYEQSKERYPVTYFFDGHNLFYDEEATYGKSWGMKRFLDSWEKSMIVVGMECSHVGDERLEEYNPYPVKWGFCAKKPAKGDKTFHWIIENVKPMIDREYRTYPDRACTAIAGSSMGGLMALYGVVRYNEYFSKAACVSSAIGFCMPQVYRDLKNYPVDVDTRVYLSWGTHEVKGMVDHEHEDVFSNTSKHNRAVGMLLANQGAAVQICCQLGGAHCEADWEKQVPRFMDFLWLDHRVAYLDFTF